VVRIELSRDHAKRAALHPQNHVNPAVRAGLA
jgi:hypothetical protein